MNNKIIQPMSDTVARISVTFDSKGNAAVEGRQVLQLNGKTIKEGPMSPLEVATRLSSVASSTLVTLLMEQNKQATIEEIPDGEKKSSHDSSN